MAQVKESEKTTKVASNEIKGRNKGYANLKPCKPGETHNPGGRPKIPEDIKKAFRELTPKAIKTLSTIIENPKAKDSDRIKASEIILDRAYGKAVQAIDMDAEVKGMPIKVVFEGDLEEWAK